MNELTFVCWKWKPKRGTRSTKKRVEYVATDVNILYAMLERNLSIPFRLLCVTDDPKGIRSGVQVVPLWKEFMDRGGCYVRLNAFRLGIEKVFGSRFISMDLDCVIVKDITDLFTRKEPFVIWGAGTKGAPYCGSMWMMDAGAHPEVYETFVSGKVKQQFSIGSDQAHIANVLCPDVATWTSVDGVYNIRVLERNRLVLPDNTRIVFFNGLRHPRDPITQRRHPWILKYYYQKTPKKVDPKPVNVVCFYWKASDRPGWTDTALGLEYVNRLYRGVKRNTTLPFKFHCFLQRGIKSDVLDENIKCQYFDSPSWAGCLPKLWVYSTQHGLTGRIVLLDLDIVIVGSLDQLFQYQGDFMSRRSFFNTNREDGDIAFFEAGYYHKFWEIFAGNVHKVHQKTRGSERLFYRQYTGMRDKADYIQDLYPGQMLSYKCNIRGRKLPIPPDGCRLVSFHGIPRPHQVDAAWVKENWR